MKNHDTFMVRCEELAEQAASKGNSKVGSMIVVDGKIIAEAEEAVTSKEDISCHAEMEVIRKARKILGRDMSAATLYSTKEPCVMCSYAIRFHKIGKVVYGEKSRMLGGANGNYNVLVSKDVPHGWGPPVQCILLQADD